MSFSTDTPPLFFEMEGVQEVSLALGHDEPVSIGCPLYNEASAVKGCLEVRMKRHMRKMIEEYEV